MKKNKKIMTAIFVCILLSITGILFAATTLTLNVETSGDTATLTWENSDTVDVYNYSIERKRNSENYSEIYNAASKPVRVLNVHPGSGDNITFRTYDGENVTVAKSGSLKKWMEEANSADSQGYGRGLIEVTPVTFDVFNSNPTKYLNKNSNGDYNQDVILFGTWDANDGKDLNTASLNVVEQFIKAKKGAIFGHDTLAAITGDRANHPNLATLAKYVNITLKTTWNSNQDTKVRIVKDSVFTKYPWNIGGAGTILNIPTAHNLGQIANGDILMKFNNDILKGNENFYLTVNNNCAMIQTGHSNCEATSDEQKILANLIFYLADLDSELKYEDKDFRDVDAPNAPTIGNKTLSGVNGTVEYTATDNGTRYDYYVKALEKVNQIENTSNTVTKIRTTDVQKYRYVIDNNKDTEPDSSSKTTTDTNLSYTLVDNSEIWLHIQSIDGAGNVSKTTHALLYDNKEEKPYITIVYNQENPNDEEYTNIGTYVIKDIEHEEMVYEIKGIENIIAEQFNALKGGESKYFKYNADISYEYLNQEINSQGNTIVNVYYDRNEYKIKFVAGKAIENFKSQIYTNDMKTVDVNNTLTFHIDEKYYANEYTIVAKYGQDISNIWPTNDAFYEVNDGESDYFFIGWRVDDKSPYYEKNEDKNIIHKYDVMSSELIIDPENTETMHEMYGIWSNKPKYYKLNFLYECLDQNYTEDISLFEYNEKKYKAIESEYVRNDINIENINIPVKPEYNMIYSNKVVDNLHDGSSEDKAIEFNMYYDRKEYKLILYNVNRKYIPSNIDKSLNSKGIYLKEDENGDKNIIVKTGADLSAIKELYNEWQKDENNKLAYPYILEDNEISRFNYWCDNLDLINEYDFNNIDYYRYDNNILLYANWTIEYIH